MSRTYWHGIPTAISYPFFHFVAMSKGSDSLVFINISTLDAIDPSRPLFRTLTHLDMFAGIEGQPLDFEFTQFTALTHLRMHGDRRPPFFIALLARCPRPHVLVSNIHPYWNRQQAHQSINIDMRFVMMSTGINVNLFVEDWSLGAQGGKDFWARAALFIDKRRRGEIEPGKYSSPVLTAFDPYVYSC
ncbi:hypothetical protein C8J57DRAFT_1655051 [Mycena rebaudengoi]|nr:hypothetical protein C8J57DRAFT_1655051 [Mycena rebaudengoi]